VYTKIWCDNDLTETVTMADMIEIRRRNLSLLESMSSDGVTVLGHTRDCRAVLGTDDPEVAARHGFATRDPGVDPDSEVMTPAHPLWARFTESLAEAMCEQSKYNEPDGLAPHVLERFGMDVAASMKFFRGEGWDCDCAIVTQTEKFSMTISRAATPVPNKTDTGESHEMPSIEEFAAQWNAMLSDLPAPEPVPESGSTLE
jgi:hypothetical protein